MSEDTEASSEVTDSTATVEESAPQAEATAAEPQEQEAAPEKPVQEDKPAPFHEHPRFKELIEQNRSFKEQSEKYQQDMYRLQVQLESLKEASKPKVEQPKDQFLADLEKVNPAYAKSLEPIYAAAQRATELEKRLSQFEQAQFAEKAVSHFNKLLDNNKITDPFDRKIMERAVRAEVYERESRGAKLTLKDLDKITNDFHAEYKSTMEARDRANAAKYVQSKKTDAAPKGATGGAATTPGMKKFKANDFAGQAKWVAEQIKGMKKEH